MFAYLQVQRLLNYVTDNIVDRGALYRQHKVNPYNNNDKEEACVHLRAVYALNLID